MLGLRTTIYKVPNLEEGKTWYAKAFKTEPYFDEPFYVGFNIGGYELGLLPDESVLGDNVLSYWGVDDIEATYNGLIDLGAVEHEPPQSVGDPIVVASVKDPWGNIIGLIFNPVFKIS